RPLRPPAPPQRPPPAAHPPPRAWGFAASPPPPPRPPSPPPAPAALISGPLSPEPPRASAVRPGLPATVDDVLARALAKSPAQRFPDSTTFIEALRAAGTMGTTAAPPAPALPPRAGPESVPATRPRANDPEQTQPE